MTLASPPATARADHIVLYDVSWAFYEHTLEEAGTSRLRITYDKGRLEMMTVSRWHEHVKTTIARLLEIYSIERGVRVTGCGSVTCKREGLQRGLEPDECYYVQTPPPPTGPNNLKFDLDLYAPPDLAVEVDVTHASIDREPIYAALGIGELWRFAGVGVAVLLRDVDGDYRPAERSRAFPDLAMNEFNRFLQQAITTDQHDAVMAFRDWLREPERRE